MGQVDGVELLQPVESGDRGGPLVGQLSGVVGVHVAHLHWSQEGLEEGTLLKLLGLGEIVE